jgi:hypothetical protein
VCVSISVFFHVTVSPNLTPIGLGRKALSPNAAAPVTIEIIFIVDQVGED